jgi:hypothetical protein
MIVPTRWHLVGLALVPAAAALALLFAGCGGKASSTSVPVSGEERLVSDVVEEFNEARQSVKQSEALFAKGSMPAPAEFKRYGQYSYWPNAGFPSLSGDSATMKVAVRDEKTGNDAGRVEWAFVKEGAAWKIKTAPLP